MTVQVERAIEVPVEPELVWEFIADPEQRARAISVVEGYELHGDGRATWHIALPLPLIDRTVAVETREVEREAPTSVTFVGDSSVMQVRGEHEVEPIEGGARLTNRFTVDGKVPGVERFFRKNLDAELENLGRALREELGERL